MGHRNPITTELARMLLADDSAIAGQGRIVLCYQAPVKNIPRTLIGGVILEDLTTQHKDWEMLEGSLIFAPMRRFTDYRYSSSSLEDIVTSNGGDLGGMLPENWREIAVK